MYNYRNSRYNNQYDNYDDDYDEDYNDYYDDHYEEYDEYDDDYDEENDEDYDDDYYYYDDDYSNYNNYYNSRNNYYDYYDDDDYYNDINYISDYNYYEKNSIENIYKFDNKTSFTQIVNKKINKNPNPYIIDNNIKILMIAEKPSIAKTIAKILSSKNSFQDLSYKNGWCLYQFNGKFKGKNAHFTVSSVAGHLYQAEFLRKHQNVNSIEPDELYDVPTVKTECDDDTFYIIDNLKKLAKNKDILCLWLDCDREGENICYEVIHNVLPYMNKKGYQQIYRALFSSLTKEDIKRSFDEIGNYPDNKLSLSVDAREIIDLKVGVSLTRFLTFSIKPHLPDKIKSNVISYGPCQTPTLWFCVERQRQIENRTDSLTYYKIFLEININEQKIKIYLDDDFKNEKDVKEKIVELQKNKLLTVVEMKSENKTLPHPNALNTVNMFKIASKELGISPNKTMYLAENLYIEGYITYPRTETTRYSPSFDFKNILGKCSNSQFFENDVKDLISDFDSNNILPYEGVDMGDHPPITPSRIPKKNALVGEKLKLFKLICNYFFATLCPSLNYNKINYIFRIGNNNYNAESSFIDELGFLKLIPFNYKNFIESKYKLNVNSEYQIANVSYEERKIKDYITEAELIEEMEKNHIGTDASMSMHIENIGRRGYVKVDDKRRLIPTKLGIALIEALESVEPDIVLPENRAKIEEFVSELAEGKKNYDEVMDYSLSFYKKKFLNVVENSDKLYDVFGKHFDLLSDEK